MADALDALLPGFADPVADAQAVFKAVMRALARPALEVRLDTDLRPPAPLAPEAAAILLALADYETPVWLDEPLRRPGVLQFLSFHTGARIVGEVGEAQFAVASSAETMPALATLRQGTPEYPDRSATLLVQVASLSQKGLAFEGPGIRQRAGFSFAGMPKRLGDELRHNRAQFPCGVDLIFASPGAIAALPRSVRLVTEA